MKNFSDEAIASHSFCLTWSDPSMLVNIGTLASPDITFSLEEELIPAGKIPVYRGALVVEATDGYIGRVEKFLVDPSDRYIAHLVLEKGHLWHKKELTLPLSAIAKMDKGYIYLNIDKAKVKSLEL